MNFYKLYIDEIIPAKSSRDVCNAASLFSCRTEDVDASVDQHQHVEGLKQQISVFNLHRDDGKVLVFSHYQSLFVNMQRVFFFYQLRPELQLQHPVCGFTSD